MASATEEPTTSKPNRSSRRLILRGLLALIVIGGGLVVLRLTSLRGLPEIAPPFDPVRDGVVDIRPEDNAFTYYIRAHEQLSRFDSTTGTWTWPNWDAVTPAQLKYVDDNRQALDTWFEGTKRDRAVYHQPGKITIAILLPAVQSLRNFASAANLVAFRYEHEGNYAKAWEWYRANLRASRHSGQHGEAIERLVGIAIYAITSPNVMRWADNPKVDLPLLKRALNDVIELDALTGPPRNTIRAEYFSMINSLDDRELGTSIIRDMVSGTNTSFWGNVKARAAVAYGTLRREPERSKRVIQHIVANWVSAADLPSAERLKRTKMHKDLPLYTASSNQAPAMDLDTLASWFETTVFARMYLPGWSNIDKALSRDEQTRAALIIHLAEQVYIREKGKAPASPDDLVGPYLKELPAWYDATAATSLASPRKMK